MTFASSVSCLELGCHAGRLRPKDSVLAIVQGHAILQALQSELVRSVRLGSESRMPAVVNLVSFKKLTLH